MINHYNLIFKKKKESWKQKAHKNQFLINISEGMYNKETKWSGTQILCHDEKHDRI